MQDNATRPKRKTREQLLEESLPQFESFIESRESYIKALEKTIQILRHENAQFNKNNIAIRNSIDELVAMQRLSAIISTASDPDDILRELVELTKQVIPVEEAHIFLFDAPANKLSPLAACSARLQQEALQQLEAGIVDWVFAEKKTIIIPDLEHLVADATSLNFVIVPLIIRNRSLGMYIIHTIKAQQEFSNQDIQLLTVLANQAAAGVENWRAHEQLTKVLRDLKTSQAQTIQSAKMAAIGELAANIVHEIKNPLQILSLHIDMVQRGRPMADWVDLISQQVRMLSSIAKRLMGFSRNVASDFVMEHTDINKALLEIVAMVEPEFKKANVILETDLADTLPTIIGNTNYLQQVFLNLFINARDAMSTGGKIIVKTESKGLRVVITVRDTGCGIADEHLERIFQPFFTTKEEGKGTGLGLSICKNIVQQHQGTITVNSEVGKGAAFTIALPVRRTSQ